jgi:hypothetical protein
VPSALPDGHPRSREDHARALLGDRVRDVSVWHETVRVSLFAALKTSGITSRAPLLPVAEEMNDPGAYLGHRFSAGAAELPDHPLHRDRTNRF